MFVFFCCEAIQHYIHSRMFNLHVVKAASLFEDEEFADREGEHHFWSHWLSMWKIFITHFARRSKINIQTSIHYLLLKAVFTSQSFSSDTETYIFTVWQASCFSPAYHTIRINLISKENSYPISIYVSLCPPLSFQINKQRRQWLLLSAESCFFLWSALIEKSSMKYYAHSCIYK